MTSCLLCAVPCGGLLPSWYVAALWQYASLEVGSSKRQEKCGGKMSSQQLSREGAKFDI